MKVLRFEEKNLHRQAYEGHLIQNFQGSKLFNGRGDWGQNLPPRLKVEGNGPPKRKFMMSQTSTEEPKSFQNATEFRHTLSKKVGLLDVQGGPPIKRPKFSEILGAEGKKSDPPFV